MKLIVGLGNPSAQYSGTRHNFGWAALDFLAEKLGADNFKQKTKIRAAIAEVEIAGEKILLNKPLTFYNLSGETVRAIRDFYNLKNSDILAIHDDLDLPVGTLRARVGGSDGGNNGVKSLNQNLGAAFARIRIGSGISPGADGSTRPENPIDYVLSRPSADDLAKLKQLLPKILEIVENFAQGKFTSETITV
ncbi:MAG: aminoacyl-tRNA hydrolase [Candidatus Nomurabacteria bacterium]|nr:aminoacyl-tRNA hydrolase [Candidatus Nomurabacteria bacterium]